MQRKRTKETAEPCESLNVSAAAALITSSTCIFIRIIWVIRLLEYAYLDIFAKGNLWDQAAF